MNMPSQYQNDAGAIAAIFTEHLTRRNMAPAIKACKLSMAPTGDTWLLMQIELRGRTPIAQLRAPETLVDLRTLAKGRPVYWLDSAAYAVLLSPAPQLPRVIPFPGAKPGVVRIGMRRQGELALTWNSLGHMLVAGMTGTGKSEFLRSIAYQALMAEFSVNLSDVDGTTAPFFRNAPNVTIASSAGESRDMVERLLLECDERKSAFESLSPKVYPDTLTEYNASAFDAGKPILRHELIIMDEFSALVAALGGAKARFATDAALLAWKGRKFGIRVVFAAQDFDKDTVGKIRSQVKTVVGFRVNSPGTARNIEIDAATRIPLDLTGRAVTNLYGAVQTYKMDKDTLIAAATAPTPNISEAEARLFTQAAAQPEGKITRATVVATLGMSDWNARNRLEAWEQRGWVAKNPAADNAYCLTQKARQLISNQPTAPTFTN